MSALDRFLIPFIYCSLARLVAARLRLAAVARNAGDVIAVTASADYSGLRSAVAARSNHLRGANRRLRFQFFHKV